MNSNPNNYAPEGVEKSETALREEAILKYWKDNGIFQKTLEKDSPMGDYNFFEGPPTANGRPGIHHVLARSFKDIIPRYKTMRGFHVRRKAGWDTHGLPVELQVEKALGLKSKKEVQEYGIAEFNRKCKESVWTYKDEWEQLTDRMGYWLDMKDPYITYDNSYIEALWATVKKIDERGFLYRDFRVGPWCTRCETQLASHELNQPGAYKDVKDLTAFVKFPIVGFEKAYFIAWTTTPWTLPGNIALAVGPDIDYVEAKVGEEIFVVAKDLISQIGDSYEIIAEHKGSEMIGMKYEPLYPFMSNLVNDEQKAKLEKAFQVYAADFVTTTDGTGIVHIAPMYGADDFELATKHELPKFHVVNEQGKYIDGCDTDSIKLSGRYVKEKDEVGKPTLAVDIIDDLTARGLLFKKENYAHSYPHCWRCDTPLLYYARTSWYFRVSQLRDQLVEANKTINWEPDHIRDGRFGEWLDGVKDWAISRDRYWGTPLPVWQTESGKRVVIGGLDDIKKYSKKSGNKYFAIRHGQGEQNVKGITSCLPEDPIHLTDLGREEVLKSAQELKDKNITRIICSPLVRTKETAETIANTLGFDQSQIIIDDRIREIHTGDYQGKAFDWRTYFTEITSFDTPIPGGESGADVRKRVEEFLYDIENRYKDETILIVTHGVFFEVIDGILDGLSHKESLLVFKHAALVSPVQTAEWKSFDFTPLPHNESYELDFHKPYIDQIELELDGEKLTRTPEVMDAWYDSGSMPVAQDHILGGPVNFDPISADYIAEGTDQTRGWFYTMHTVANMLHDKPIVMYKNVVCLGLLMAADGTKMSKSKGNIVSPWEVFEKFGADVARFWFYSVNQPGEAKNFDEKSLDEVKKKVFNPLLNVVSFYEMYKPVEVPNINPFDSSNVLDQWILANLQQLSQLLVKNLDSYKVLESARGIRDFVNELSTWYVRRSRDRFKSDNVTDRDFALVTLQYVLEQLSRYIAPFTPFTAEDIFLRVRDLSKEESVHLTQWHMWDSESRFAGTIPAMQTVRDIVTLGLEARQKANIKVRQPLKSLKVASEALSSDYLDIIKDELNVKEVVIDNSLAEGTVELDTEITEDLKNEGDMRDLVRMIQDMRKTADLSPNDQIIAHLVALELKWYGDTELRQELLKTVGAKEIKWGSEVNKVEKQ